MASALDFPWNPNQFTAKLMSYMAFILISTDFDLRTASYWRFEMAVLPVCLLTFQYLHVFAKFLILARGIPGPCHTLNMFTLGQPRLWNTKKHILINTDQREREYLVVIFKEHLVSLSAGWCMNLFYSLVGVFIAFSREQCDVINMCLLCT